MKFYVSILIISWAVSTFSEFPTTPSQIDSSPNPTTNKPENDSPKKSEKHALFNLMSSNSNETNDAIRYLVKPFNEFNYSFNEYNEMLQISIAGMSKIEKLEVENFNEGGITIFDDITWIYFTTWDQHRAPVELNCSSAELIAKIPIKENKFSATSIVRDKGMNTTIGTFTICFYDMVYKMNVSSKAVNIEYRSIKVAVTGDEKVQKTLLISSSKVGDKIIAHVESYLKEQVRKNEYLQNFTSKIELLGKELFTSKIDHFSDKDISLHDQFSVRNMHNETIDGLSLNIGPFIMTGLSNISKFELSNSRPKAGNSTITKKIKINELSGSCGVSNFFMENSSKRFIFDYSIGNFELIQEITLYNNEVLLNYDLILGYLNITNIASKDENKDFQLNFANKAYSQHLKSVFEKSLKDNINLLRPKQITVGLLTQIKNWFLNLF